MKNGVTIPPSLKNIFKELQSDLGYKIPTSGNLEFWAKQGVLLLNASLTVRAHKPGSHQKKGWEMFTDNIIELISRKHEHIVFILWGNFAQQKVKLIDEYEINGDFVESQAFAFLAIRSYKKLPISFPNTTNCKQPCSGGEIIEN